MQVFFLVSIHGHKKKSYTHRDTHSDLQTRTARSLGTRLVTSFSTGLSRTPKTPGK